MFAPRNMEQKTQNERDVVDLRNIMEYRRHSMLC